MKLSKITFLTSMLIVMIGGFSPTPVLWSQEKDPGLDQEGGERSEASLESTAVKTTKKNSPMALTPIDTDKFGAPEPSNPSPANTSNNPTANSPTPSSNGTTEKTEDLIYLNAADADITDIIKQISKATGTNFLIDDKLKGKITIISEKPMTKTMAYQAFLSALQVMGYTTVTTPAGLVKIVQTKEAISNPIDIYKSDTPDTDKYITRIFDVKNISANEIASVIKSLVSKDGNLFAYPATNSLIITDSGSNIDRIMKIVKELDTEGPQEVIEMIPIQYADADDITTKITQLFEQGDAGGSSAKSSGARRGGRGSAETELQDTPSISKVISDERTNTVIVLGTKRSIVKVKALINQLDTPVSGADGDMHVYYLKYANSKELADVLSSLVSNSKSSSGSKKSGGSKTTSNKGSGGDNEKSSSAPSGGVELTGDVKVTADENTNSLVITASPKDYQLLIDKVISKLDIPRRQVYLEAIVMELTVNTNRTLGVSGNMGNVFSAAGNDIGSFGAVLPIFPSAVSGLLTAAGGMGGGIASERTISFTGLDGTKRSIPAVSALIQALQTDQDANILSTPSILTLDNQEAQIQVGNEIGIPGTTTVGSGGVASTSVTREDTGVILKITPQISESDTVRLNIEQEITSVLGAIDPVLGPTLTKRSVKTVVVANDKQTIVIGGLIDDQATVSTAKVPFLGDIPVLGNLFKTQNKLKSKTNIVVFITPYVIRDKADYLAILQRKIEERNAFIDMNYGTGQQKAIRASIKNHAKNLLQYKDAVYKGYPNSTKAVTSPTSSAITPYMVPQENVAITSSASSAETSSANSPATSSQATSSSSDRVRYRSRSR